MIKKKIKFAVVIQLIVAGLLVTSCSKKEENARQEFLTPKSTYTYWIDAGVKGDLALSMDCLTEASKRMMDQMSKDRDEFIRRMTASSAVFKTYSIVDERISGDRAIVLTESPDKKGRISTPFVLEGNEWKVDLVKMFGG